MSIKNQDKLIIGVNYRCGSASKTRRTQKIFSTSGGQKLIRINISKMIIAPSLTGLALVLTPGGWGERRFGPEVSIKSPPVKDNIKNGQFSPSKSKAINGSRV